MNKAVNILIEHTRSLGNTLSNVFKQMEIMEEEIARAISNHPDKAGQIDNAFLLGSPSDLMNTIPTLDERAYRSHVRELLNRVANGTDVSLGTNLEMLIILVHASLSAPLDRVNSYLYGQLFIKVYGKEIVEDLFQVGRDGLEYGDYSIVFESAPWETVEEEHIPHLQRKAASQYRKDVWKEIKDREPRKNIAAHDSNNFTQTALL